jgi:hypothetical protein
VCVVWVCLCVSCEVCVCVSCEVCVCRVGVCLCLCASCVFFYVCVLKCVGVFTIVWLFW